MIHHQTYGPSPAAAVLCLSDLDTSTREPRVYDLTLARVLGYEHARNIRRLIKTARAELQTHGELVEIRDRSGGTGNLLQPGANTLTPRAGRPGAAFYLNEGQALVVCALTRTAVAARVRGELIRVFMLHRVGELRSYPQAVTRELAPSDRRALQEIVKRADVVMAPPCSVTPMFGEGAYYGGAVDAGIGHDPRDGFVPYLLAPITEEILDTLAEFEADLADMEDGQDAEGNCVEDEGEPDHESEPSLGSFGCTNQEGWAGRGAEFDVGTDRELDTCDDEETGDDEPAGDENEPSLGSFNNRGCQLGWGLAGNDQELEEQCEDEGVNTDSEPSLGAVEAGTGPHRVWANNPAGAAPDGDADTPAVEYRQDIPAHVLIRCEAKATRKAAQRLAATVAMLQRGGRPEARQ